MTPSRDGYKSGKHALTSMGIAKIRFPTDESGNNFKYLSDIVPIDVPLLFRLDLMEKYRIRIEKVDNRVTQKEQG